MHNNYYFLRQLSKTLDDIIRDYNLVACFSQNKDELIIELNNSKKSFFIKASLQSSVCCLSFPSKFSRAGKNSVDIFNPILLKKVIYVYTFENERSFCIAFENNYALIFKIHPNRCNAILSDGSKVIGIFRNQFKSDLNIDLHSFNRTIDWSEAAFIRNHQKLEKLYFTFGKGVWTYLISVNFEELDIGEQWELLNKTLKYLDRPKFYILKEEGKLKLSLFRGTHIVESFSNPIEAINEFFYLHISHERLLKEKIEALKKLRTTIKFGKNYIEKSVRKLKEIEGDTHYKTWADLLMAHMHKIQKGVRSITLEDFSGSSTVEIKLKPELSIQQNAEKFYRKSKNREIETNKLRDAISQKEKKLEFTHNLIKEIEAATSLKELEKIYKNPSSKVTLNQGKKLPYYKFEHLGFQIWVGKNAVSNDQLTLRYSHKDDLWLHVKDVSGSHVLIKHRSGVNFPLEVIKRAAALAAYNSKRKSEKFCPVVYTPKKFVRKRKGDPAGAVVVEREQVIMVEPKL